MPAKAHLVHRARGRLRLRIPERRHDTGFFAELEERLLDLPGIIGVSVNPTSAGVLIRLDPASDHDPLTAIEAGDLLEILDGPPPLTPGLSALRGAVSDIDRMLDSNGQHSLDLRTLSVLALLALALHQAARGEILGSMASLLWYASELTRRASPRPDAQPQSRDKDGPDQT